jgi:hypothetical protein
VYVYPSHDIPAGEGRGRIGWFCMEDYHVFSSENLSDWTDHGVIVSQDKVPWVNSKSYSMWNEWTIVNSHLSELQSGIHNLAVLLTDDSNVEFDWIRFE